MSGRLTDDELITASVEAPEQFAAIFDRHYVSIRRYLSRRLPHALAEELASEVFAVGFDRRSSYRAGISDARPWLLGIAANLLRHHRRTEHRALRAFAEAGKDPLSPWADKSRDEDGSVAPEVAEALASLNAKDRELLFLFAYADLTYEELSRALETPIGTVRSRLHRARKRLRDRLQAAGVVVVFDESQPRRELDERDQPDPVVS